MSSYFAYPDNLTPSNLRNQFQIDTFNNSKTAPTQLSSNLQLLVLCEFFYSKVDYTSYFKAPIPSHHSWLAQTN
jgi:hypothetical protein